MSNSIFLDFDTFTTQILPTLSPPADNAEMTNPPKIQPSTLSMVPKSLRPYWSDSCRKYNVKDVCRCVSGDVGS